ncbi:acetyl/propionyl/methylcrotonyl-CoA carboxylase subunit alpha [Planktotalea arctica]|uniref:acetyl/propionyl/methylcrotonyl-CoA carboxylase subunit alpha n=1 Tax=Planktotalea arctica TaxID=1481893 RepID=UPI003218EA33
MFDAILIANRGEIACRIMQTAQAMGVRCVAVYSDADAVARHVQMADDAVYIGGSSPANSYLRGDVIIKAALGSGAQAIHPGYGFLSENPDFVEAVEAAGLTFIGPSSAAIRAMGLKDAAKVLMEKAGVPVVPGYHGKDQNDDLLAHEAVKIGYPVLIKAVAGGGGKGMRLVEQPSEFADALQSARSEAKAAFGNSDVLVEKFVTKPRHIEVQVFGDGTSAVHLFERDCSLQRRHQKVIEEAPAPGMTDAVRAAMGAASVRAAEAIGYAGAGTIEFIVDGSDGLREDGFWFMEMNTRLQVEHPVTEAVTGVDLVEWQLRVASGEALPKTQEELTLTGHAFEARLYAEDAAQDFLPATGRLAHLAFASGARADTGVRSGDEISPFYDPMIAKLTVHGPTREVALARLRKALGDTQVAGTVTNLGFLHALASHRGFASGDVDTGLIARDYDVLVAKAELSAQALAQGAMMAAINERHGPETGFTLWQPLARMIALQSGGERYDCAVHLSGAHAARIETPLGTVHAMRRGAAWLYGGAPQIPAKRIGSKVYLFGPQGVSFDIVDPLERSSAAGGDTDVIVAPMPGLVKAMLAQSGQKVAQGDRLAVLEAMKMEHSLLAQRAGVVAEVLASTGAQVEAGAALIRLEPETETDT